jgi:hypothetical protein
MRLSQVVKRPVIILAKEAPSWRHGARHSVYVQHAAIGSEDVTLSILQVSIGQLIAGVSVPIHGVDFGEQR